MDPKLTEDGKPYGPVRFKNIVQERYFISKKCHTSYLDVGEITPLERGYILEFILDEIEKEKKAIEDAKRNKNRK
jgi:hypothetical protein